MANNNKTQKNKVVSLLFWVYILVALVVLVVGTIWIVAANNATNFEKYEDLKQLNERDMFIQYPEGNEEFDKYYVILYTRSTENDLFKLSTEQSNEVEPFIMHYAEFFKSHKGGTEKEASYPLANIYGADLSLEQNRKCLTTDSNLVNYNATSFSGLQVYQKVMPVLLYFENGTVKSYNVGYNNIASYLTKVMANIE